MFKDCLKILPILIFLFANQLSAQQKQLWSKIDEAKIGNENLQRSKNLKNQQFFQLKIYINL